MANMFDIFKIGIGPPGSHIVGPMNAEKSFIDRLESSDLLTTASHTVVGLCRSLSLTGKGHVTDAAVIMGLAENSPQGAVIDETPAFIEPVTYSGRLSVAFGIHIVDFSVAKNIILYPEVLPCHENGMRIIAWKGQEVLLSKTYHSVNGELIIGEEHSSLSHNVRTFAPYDFHSAGELPKMCDYNGLSISGLMMHNELVLRSKAETDTGSIRIQQVMYDGIKCGINTEGVLPGPLNMPRCVVALRCQLVSGGNVSNDSMNIIDWTNIYALVVSEEDAAGGRVVTVPTNGTCGTIPAVLVYYGKFHRPVNERLIARYFLTARVIGVPYKMNASISGAEIDCQGEIGIVYSMTTTGLTELLGGGPVQACNAAEIAAGHNLRLTYSPVAGQVQIPCIERSVTNAAKTVNAARTVMHRTSVPHVLLDKVIETMYGTGKDMNDKYRETLRGGPVIKVVCG